MREKYCFEACPTTKQLTKKDDAFSVIQSSAACLRIGKFKRVRGRIIARVPRHVRGLAFYFFDRHSGMGSGPARRDFTCLPTPTRAPCTPQICPLTSLCGGFCIDGQRVDLLHLCRQHRVHQLVPLDEAQAFEAVGDDPQAEMALSPEAFSACVARVLC